MLKRLLFFPRDKTIDLSQKDDLGTLEAAELSFQKYHEALDTRLRNSALFYFLLDLITMLKHARDRLTADSRGQSQEHDQ